MMAMLGGVEPVSRGKNKGRMQVRADVNPQAEVQFYHVISSANALCCAVAYYSRFYTLRVRRQPRDSISPQSCILATTIR